MDFSCSILYLHPSITVSKRQYFHKLIPERSQGKVKEDHKELSNPFYGGREVTGRIRLQTSPALSGLKTAGATG
jgi:hypothetical protein